MSSGRLRSLSLPVLALTACFLLAVSASAQVTLTQLSQDTFTNSESQHQSEVEPSSYTWGSTIVSAFQVARIYGGGGADIGFATSTDGGTTWKNGYLPGITIFQGNGTYQAASDASVAYDALHNTWMIQSLPIGTNNNVVAVSLSTDGLTWGKPVFITKQGSADKNWIVCDNTATSPYYGHCYSEWDDTSQGDFLQMSTSTDGGITWSKPVGTAGNDFGIGGVPLVLPKGTVVVPFNGFSGYVMAFSSTDGGKTWTRAVNVGTDAGHGEDGGIRSAGLIGAAVDAGGKVYVAWPGCTFRTGCAENDIVYSTSKNGTKWAKIKRVPIDPTTSTVDHFIVGIGIAPGTKAAKAHVAVDYYFYPQSSCGNSCQLYAGFIQSSTGGKTWSAPVTLAGPMQLTWLPNTFSGYMVADYIAMGWGNGKAFPIFAAATAPKGSTLHEAMYTTASGFQPSRPEDEYLTAEFDLPVPDAHSDHGPREYLDQENRIPVSDKTPPPDEQ